MNIEKMLESMTPEKLEMSLAKLSGVLSEEQIRQVKKVLSTTDKNTLSNQLKNVDVNKIKDNPDFKNILNGK